MARAAQQGGVSAQTFAISSNSDILIVMLSALLRPASRQTMGTCNLCTGFGVRAHAHTHVLGMTWSSLYIYEQAGASLLDSKMAFSGLWSTPT